MHKILLALDGSQASDEAVKLIARFPHLDRLDITFISVIQHPYAHGSYFTPKVLEKAFERDKEFAVEIYDRVSAMFDGANATTSHLIKEGNIGEAIIETAKEMDADLVVVGAKGKSQISRVLLGSVSDHVATHAPCSVLVVRPTGLSESVRPIRVCLAYDASGPSQAALEEVSQIPWRSGTDFHVLSVASYLRDYFGELSEDSETAKRFAAELSEAKLQLAEVAPQARTHRFESEQVGEGIVTFAEEKKIDLLVVGETPRNVVNRFLMGSTTRYVLRHAPCSVWITRNRMIHGLSKRSTQEVAGIPSPE